MKNWQQMLLLITVLFQLHCECSNEKQTKDYFPAFCDGLIYNLMEPYWFHRVIIFFGRNPMINNVKGPLASSPDAVGLGFPIVQWVTAAVVT